MEKVYVSDDFGEFNFYDSIESIKDMEGYSERVDPKVESFDVIVGWYKLKDGKMTRCQKVDCQQMHNTGYVIRLKSGCVTNIGNICGKEFDPDNFIIQERLAKNKIRHYLVVQRVSEMRGEVDKYIELVNEVEKLARDFMNAKGDFKRGVEGGEKIFGHLVGMAKRSDYAVIRTRTLSDAEYEEARKIRESPARVVHEEIGRIAYASCLSIEEHVVYLKAKKSLQALQSVDIERGGTQQLQKVAKDISEIGSQCAVLKAALLEFDKFVNYPRNKELLPFIL
ncbi:hypothetical protein [Chromobacterium subtsugae]|uniref:hypothetical protein n=1 Tax=Chromobacterium subtsugae TaxID=251747 RepID=UPI000AC51B58|nr:hypothetical protein [Chromobacterium subtsugae]